MQFQFFQIPTGDPAAAAAALNGFLRSHRIVAVRSELVRLGETAFWAFSVEYLEGAGKDLDRMLPKVDYREVLKEAEFKVFSRLREWRKGVAEKEGVPVYTVFTNEQLAEMARQEIRTRADLGKIDGVGEARLSKYGEAVLTVLGAAVANPTTTPEIGKAGERDEASRPSA
jgi:superfamily II DNA helicase RecQ